MKQTFVFDFDGVIQLNNRRKVNVQTKIRAIPESM